jgi:hypothetical protein
VATASSRLKPSVTPEHRSHYHPLTRSARLAMVVPLLLALGCSAPFGSSPTASVGPKSGFTCPVTRGVSPPAKADPTIAAPQTQGMTFGRGPVYAVIFGASHEVIPFPTAGPDGLFIQKVQWLTNRSYRGKVTVSGRRLDGPGGAFVGGDPPDQSSVSWSVPGSNGYFEPGVAAVRNPGCYQWDVVGLGFSYNIVFNASVDRM